MTLCCYVSHVASITICPANDIDVDDDDTCNSTLFIILFVLSLAVNILLAVVIIYFILKQRKNASYSSQV